jgi:hypothetical protein
MTKVLFKKAVEINDIPTVRDLFNHKDVNIGKTKSWALMLSAKRGFIEIFKMLLEDPFADATYKNNAAIKTTNDTEILKLLFKKEEVKAIEFIDKLLINSVQTGCAESLDFLLGNSSISDPSELFKYSNEHHYIDKLKVLDKYFEFDYSHNNNEVFLGFYNDINEYICEDEASREDECFQGDTDYSYLKGLSNDLLFYWNKKEVKEKLKTNHQELYQEFMKSDIILKIAQFQ